MKLLHYLIRPFLFSALMVLFGSGLSFPSELDDSSLFVEAFHANRDKDFLLAIEKINQLEQLFPDSSLRDVSLLLLARAGLGAGDNELAAKSVGRYLSEFADNPLTAGVEDDLLGLAARRKNGEKILPDRQLMSAAQKVRNHRLALAKAEAERRERERAAAEKAARESIRLAISMPPGKHSFKVGKEAVIPFEIINRSSGKEEFIVSTQLAGEYSAKITLAGRDGQLPDRIAMSSGETVKGHIAFMVPTNKVDGHKINIPVTAVSARFNDIVFKSEKQVNASAPLLRAVIRPSSKTISRGGRFRCHIVVLNAGSLPATDLTIRVTLPEQTKLVDGKAAGYVRESDRVALFRVESLQTGRLVQFDLEGKAGANLTGKKDSRCQVEVLNNQLKLKDVFAAGLKPGR